ncbi:U3 small nucleolar RNA-associated protein 25 [Hyaloscypha variabilis F]|uniref:U3 small nucleolar RNA-associated protein 25 n=1 Tax=Hyaloscypha variabilis (strain UAMH 11265 / GT02V1 / F) TaxID=1149755 RepID=A0A2J6S0C0_HYAVF|nr:U3 small nucleolar RNA-associated protein 25 [Hyaloscypha variabilis F]
MVFHGSRGGSRGRGNSRGGGRGASSSGSRGRGRGRGGFRGGRGKPVFDSARIAQQKESEADNESEPENPSEVEGELGSQDESSGDEEPVQVIRSYAALMQSFATDSTPQAKRRKLDLAPGSKSFNIEEDTSEVVAEDSDEVEEPEEGPETATEGLAEDEDDLEDASDPFEAHFADPDDNILSRRLKSLATSQWAAQKLSIPKFGKVVMSVPGSEEPRASSGLRSMSGPADLKLKQKLAGVISKQLVEFDSLEKYIAPSIFDYQDILYCERRPTNSEILRRLVCLHVINHIFKTRDRVIKNNARLAKEENNDDLELRDQGFTRPKVLMILPTRESCVRMVKMITLLCEPDQQENRKRFDDSYLEKEEKFSEDKPQDFRELFAGNDDDMFRLGLKFTRKTIKYFSQFYNSDIIFASPLGLRLTLEGKDDKKGDYDFLSSIEIVIVDQADALLMQNWEHVEYIFEHLNLQPREAHGCDFSRVRSWYLDNNAKFFRQTITLAAFNTPELNTLFYNQSKNWGGKMKISANYSGAIQELGLKIKQTFSRLESLSFATDPDARFIYFTTAIIPSLTSRAKDSSGTVIFIPSYLDFVRVRNYFSTSPATSSLSFGSISEYTSVKDVARARSHFFSGRHSVLLYTERAHHFRRYQLRGVRKVIMYGLPDNPVFYKEIVGGYLGKSVQEGKLEPGEGNARIIFSKWDILKLERIVGTERVGKMIKEKGDTFDFL